MVGLKTRIQFQKIITGYTILLMLACQVAVACNNPCDSVSDNGWKFGAQKGYFLCFR